MINGFAILLALQITSYVSSAPADNALTVSLFAQLSSGHFCADIKQADVRNSNMACATPFARTLSKMAGPASMLLDTITFDAAAGPQIQRDRCFAQRTRALKQLPAKLLNGWRANLAFAWLSRRKAKLTLQFCDENFSTHVPPTMAAKDSSQAWEEWKRVDHLAPLFPGDPKMQEAREKKMEPWAPICFNRDALKALRQADDIIPYMVPVTESETLFNEIGARRDLITNPATGRPLSDPEILNLDMRDLKKINLTLDSKVMSSLDQRLSDIADARERSAAGLERVKDGNGHYQLSPDQRQYLYEEGTVYDALHAQYAAEGDPKLPAALACFDARYGPQGGSELMSLAFWSAVTGGTYGALLGNIRFAKSLSAIAKAQKSLAAGSALAGADEGLRQVWDACTKTKSMYGKQTYSKKSETDAQSSSFDLPAEIGYTLKGRALEIDPKLAPACNDKELQNALVRADDTRSCAAEIAINGLPNIFGLPR